MKTKKATAPLTEKAEEPVNLDNIDHIAIPVLAGEVDATVDFYLKNFGCSVIYRDHSWAFLRFGNIKLAFVVPDEHPPHLAFISAKAEQFGELKTHRDGTRSVYISDPSDNTIEIMAPTET
jgi:catechol 2,3-dioxygenase-like lactoylglutathione lyase family enzyme